MAGKPYTETTIRQSGEKGAYSKGDWLRESQLHILSAKMLRECSSQKKAIISTLISTEHQSKRAEINKLISEREAGNKASFLLMGYAFEMLLKSGVVCLYVDIPRDVMIMDIKRLYGHKLRRMAKEIEAPLSEKELTKLDVLSKWIVDSARYPVTPHNETSYSEQWNKLIREFWNDVQFEEYLSLYDKIHSHVSKIDASSDDPKTSSKWSIDDDGYVIYRIGGKLKPRLIVRYSSNQRDNGNDNKDFMKTLMLNNVDHPAFKAYLSRDWDTAIYREIK